ncbi:MAG: tetratricopeptide repeat protein [Nitrospirota bacterium]
MTSRDLLSPLLCLPLFIAAPSAAWAAENSAPLFDNLGSYHHAISTGSPQVQRYFDQGMVLSFAFNHAEAIRSFREAIRLDPDCAMCHWGVAYALGPNINSDMDRKGAREAYKAIRLALKKADRATEAEQAYVRALAVRYAAKPPSDRKALDLAYADAMRDLAHRFPDDVDAATLFAESLMDTTPWHYWTEDGQPGPVTEELVATLESVLARAPEHPFALHLYIHAMEASPTPERAEAAADRLGPLVPGAGHLVHMPAHIYLRIGRYSDAEVANAKAAAADEAYFAHSDHSHAEGLYAAGYYLHNIHFLWQAALFEGRSHVALEAARKLAREVTPGRLKAHPEAEHFLPIPLFTLARFGRWDEILAEPKPPAAHRYHRAMWHYARGLALAAGGRLKEAGREARQLDRLAAGLKRKAGAETPSVPAADLVALAGHLLAAEIADRGGRSDEMLRHYRDAVQIQDRLPYMEPPYWYYPVRQDLGMALLRLGRPGEAEEAFRESLRRHPRNGWSLYGLAQSQKQQGKAEAVETQRRFEEAWARADVPLADLHF